MSNFLHWLIIGLAVARTEQAGPEPTQSTTTKAAGFSLPSSGRLLDIQAIFEEARAKRMQNVRVAESNHQRPTNYKQLPLKRTAFVKPPRTELETLSLQHPSKLKGDFAPFNQTLAPGDLQVINRLLEDRKNKMVAKVSFQIDDHAATANCPSMELVVGQRCDGLVCNIIRKTRRDRHMKNGENVQLYVALPKKDISSAQASLVATAFDGCLIKTLMFDICVKHGCFRKSAIRKPLWLANKCNHSGRRHCVNSLVMRTKTVLTHAALRIDAHLNAIPLPSDISTLPGMRCNSMNVIKENEENSAFLLNPVSSAILSYSNLLTGSVSSNGNPLTWRRITYGDRILIVGILPRVNMFHECLSECKHHGLKIVNILDLQEMQATEMLLDKVARFWTSYTASMSWDDQKTFHDVYSGERFDTSFFCEGQPTFTYKGSFEGVVTIRCQGDARPGKACANDSGQNYKRRCICSSSQLSLEKLSKDGLQASSSPIACTAGNKLVSCSNVISAEKVNDITNILKRVKGLKELGSMPKAPIPATFKQPLEQLDTIFNIYNALSLWSRNCLLWNYNAIVSFLMEDAFSNPNGLEDFLALATLKSINNCVTEFGPLTSERMYMTQLFMEKTLAHCPIGSEQCLAMFEVILDHVQRLTTKDDVLEASLSFVLLHQVSGPEQQFKDELIEQFSSLMFPHAKDKSIALAAQLNTLFAEGNYRDLLKLLSAWKPDMLPGSLDSWD